MGRSSAGRLPSAPLLQLAGRWQARRHALRASELGSRSRPARQRHTVASSCWPMSTALWRPGLPGRRSPHWPSDRSRCARTSPARLRSGADASGHRRRHGTLKREIPHYYLASQIDFPPPRPGCSTTTASSDPRQRLLPAALLLKATALALREQPRLNGFHQDGAFRPGLASMSAGPSRCAAAAWSRPRSTTPTDSRCPS